MKYRTHIPVLILSPLLLLFCITGCASTANYYTGKTLERGEGKMTIGADGFLLGSLKETQPDDVTWNFMPSFSFATGLPNRFEVRFKTLALIYTEAVVRWQATPAGFEMFQISSNLHYGLIVLKYPYWKYGFTLSKEFSRVEPYLSYFRVLSSVFQTNRDEWFKIHLDSNRGVSIGSTLTVQNFQLIPEINYSFHRKDPSKGFVIVSLGIQLPL